MQILLTAFCEHADLRPDGRMDVHGAFHDLVAPGFPAKQDEMVLAIAVEWAPEDSGRYVFKVELQGDAPNPSFTVNGQTEVATRDEGERPQRTFLVMPLQEIVFPQPGPYRLTISIKGEEIAGPTLYLWEVPDAGSAE